MSHPPKSSDTKHDDTPRRSRENVPKTIGKFQLIRQLGAGGMGAVFLATDLRTNRTVALKVLPRDKAQNATLVKRFRAEAQAAANLEHENIVRVYEADEADGYLYISLEYVDGTDVDQLLKKRERIPVKRSTEIIRQVASALQHAHEQNIVHRDIKPSNLMIRKDRVVKVTDLGLARSIDETIDSSITREGTTVGTVDYMAPEQARNSRLADIRSDLYSLGCTWYQMLTGHAPFHEGSLTNKLQAHATAPPPDPRIENPEVPESIVAIIARLMAKKPDDRYQTPHELIKDLDNAHLHRSTVSDNVFAALAHSGDDGSQDMPTAAPQTQLPPRTTNTPARGNATVPPRDKPPPTAPRKRTDDDESGSLAEKLKYVLAACGFIVVMLGLWWIIQTIAGAIDPGATEASIADSQRRQAEEFLGPSGTSTPPSVANVNGDAPPATDVRPVDANLVDTPGASTQRPAPTNGMTLSEIGSEADRELVPEWSRQVPAQSEVDALLAALKLPTKTVGRDDARQGDIATLDQALREIPPGGAIFRLLGDGPFLLPARELVDVANLVLTADGDRRPVVVLLADESGPADALLRFRNCKVMLLGLHLVVPARQITRESIRSIVHLSDGNLMIRGGSLSLLGSTAHPLAAVHLAGSGDLGRMPRVLIDRFMIRGACIGLRQDRASFDAIVSRSLFLCQSHPACVLTGSMAGVPTTSELAEDSRHLRLLSSTIVTSVSAIEIDPGKDRQRPSPIKITLRRSLLIAAEGNERPLIALRDWPVSEQADPRIKSLLWDEDACRVVGWPALLKLDGNQLLDLADGAGWLEYFGRRFPVPQHATGPAIAIADGLSPDLSRYRSSSLVANLPERFSNELGVNPSDVALPTPDAMEIAAAVSRLEAARLAAFAKPGPTVELDLGREDIGRRISTGDWVSGTRFLIKGKSPRAISPIVVRNKSLIIEFDSSVEDVVRLEAPPRDPGNALIDVIGGSLVLRNVRCRFLSRTRDPLPVSIVRVRDGSLHCDRCQFVGAPLPNSAHKSLIRWETGPGDARSLDASSLHRHVCLIEGCFLSGTAVGLDATLDASLVRMVNTVIATVEPCLRFEHGATPATDFQPSTLDVRSCTLTSGTALVSLTGEPVATDGPGLFCLLRESVFAPPLAFGERTAVPTVLEATPPWRESGRLFWWERANGYSTLYPAYVRAPGERPEPQNFRNHWQAFWGVSRVQRPLTSADGVLLATEYSELAKLNAQSFLLHQGARANQWSADGSWIGANLSPAAKATANERPQGPVKVNPRVGGF